jgi:hypothetical protein
MLRGDQWGMMRDYVWGQVVLPDSQRQEEYPARQLCGGQVLRLVGLDIKNANGWTMKIFLSISISKKIDYTTSSL